MGLYLGLPQDNYPGRRPQAPACFKYIKKSFISISKSFLQSIYRPSVSNHVIPKPFKTIVGNQSHGSLGRMGCGDLESVAWRSGVLLRSFADAKPYHYKYQWQRCSKSVFWHGCCHASVGKPFRVWVGGCRNGKQMVPKWIRNGFEWIEMVWNGFKWLWNGFKMVFPDFFACSKTLFKKPFQIHFRSISPGPQKPLICQCIFMFKPFRIPPSQQQTSASAASQQQISASTNGLGKYRPKRYGFEMVLRNGYKVFSNGFAGKFKIYGFCRKEIHNPRCI